MAMGADMHKAKLCFYNVHHDAGVACNITIQRSRASQFRCCPIKRHLCLFLKINYHVIGFSNANVSLLFLIMQIAELIACCFSFKKKNLLSAVCVCLTK